jgi:hypothetical protein
LLAVPGLKQAASPSAAPAICVVKKKALTTVAHTKSTIVSNQLSTLHSTPIDETN